MKGNDFTSHHAPTTIYSLRRTVYAIVLPALGSV